MSVILNNPFYILKASSKDNRQKIVELADERSFEIDEGLCQEARATLTMPKNRLSAEMDWMHGISVNKIIQIIESIQNGDKEIYKQNIPNLAKLNIILELLDSLNFNGDELYGVVSDAADCVDELNADEIIKDINNDRSVAGFVLVNDSNEIYELLADKQQECSRLIIKQLDNMPINQLIETLTNIVNSATLRGENHASLVIENVVDDYKLRTQNFLEQEKEKIEKLIYHIKKNANSKDTVEKLVEKLINIAKNWDKVAQPIQLIMKSRGLNDSLSNELAVKIRSLGIELYNNHGYLEISQYIFQELAEIFAELPEMIEKIENDTETLENLAHQAKMNEIEFNENLKYEAEIGIVFKDKLIINKNGLSWKDVTYPFESIEEITWWAVSNYINGIPTGTVYNISFRTSIGNCIIETRKDRVFLDVTDRLWKTSGLIIMGKILQDLGSEKVLRLDDVKICNDGVCIIKQNWFSSNEEKKIPFKELIIYTHNGSLIIEGGGFQKTLSYKEVYNLHFIEAILKLAIDKKLSKISDLR